MIKNFSDIRHGSVGWDRDNFVIGQYGAPLDSPSYNIVDTPVTVFHYGWARNDCVTLLKKYRQEVEWWGKAYWKEHEFPFRFDNPKALQEYNQRHPQWMYKIILDEKKKRWIDEFTKGVPCYYFDE